jgi:hypothetical protein
MWTLRHRRRLNSALLLLGNNSAFRKILINQYDNSNFGYRRLAAQLAAGSVWRNVAGRQSKKL